MHGLGWTFTSPGSNAMKFPLPEGIRVAVSAAVLMVTTGVMGPAKSRVAARRASRNLTRTRRDAVIGNLSPLVWRGRRTLAGLKRLVFEVTARPDSRPFIKVKTDCDARVSQFLGNVRRFDQCLRLPRTGGVWVEFGCSECLVSNFDHL